MKRRLMLTSVLSLLLATPLYAASYEVAAPEPPSLTLMLLGVALVAASVIDRRVRKVQRKVRK
jgi:hypothetical protein